MRQTGRQENRGRELGIYIIYIYIYVILYVKEIVTNFM